MHKVFKVHSIVDVITNSSTVIYTQATEATVKSFRNMINAILDIAGSEIRADDLFIFRLIPNVERVTDAMLDFSDEFDRDSVWYKDLMEKYPDYNDHDPIIEAKAMEIIKDNPSVEWLSDLIHKGECDINLLVIAKDDKSEAAAKILSSMIDTIDTEEDYN